MAKILTTKTHGDEIAVLERVAGALSDGVDSPAAPGVSFTGGKGDVAIDDPLMALLGEPLDAMVQNLGRSNNGYVSLGAFNAKVASQGFTTGSAQFGYRLQGIGVNIEGSSNRIPAGPTSVSVAVYSDSNGQPGTKLVDLVSPGEFAAGHSFFEAPPGTNLEASTSYVMVWSYLGIFPWHRLQKTSSNGEDSGALANFSIANAFYRGADLDSLSEDSGGNALEIAVYGEVNTETVVYIMEPAPPPPPPPPFIPGVTGGGGRHPQVLRPAVRKLPHVRGRRPGGGFHPLVGHHDGGNAPHSRWRKSVTIIGYSPNTGSLGSKEFTYRGTDVLDYLRRRGH